MTRDDLTRPVDLIRRFHFEQWLLLVGLVVTLVFGVNIMRALVERHQAWQRYLAAQERLERAQVRFAAIQAVTEEPRGYRIIRKVILIFRRGPEGVAIVRTNPALAPSSSSTPARTSSVDPPLWREWLRAFGVLPERNLYSEK